MAFSREELELLTKQLEDGFPHETPPQPIIRPFFLELLGKEL
jgi:hypothetical protein